MCTDTVGWAMCSDSPARVKLLMPGHGFENAQLGQRSVAEVALYVAVGHGYLTLTATLRTRCRGARNARQSKAAFTPNGQRPLIMTSDTCPSGQRSRLQRQLPTRPEA